MKLAATFRFASPGRNHRVDLWLDSSACLVSFHALQQHLIVIGHGVPQGRLHDDAHGLADRHAVPVAAHDPADKEGDGEIRASGVLLANVLLNSVGAEAGHGAPARRFWTA